MAEQEAWLDAIGREIVDASLKVHKELGPLRLGYLINFNVRLLRDGVRRYAL